MLIMRISYLWWTHISPVLKYILASAVSSYDFPGCPDKYFQESLYIMLCYFPEWMGVFMNSRNNRKYTGLDATNKVLLKSACSATVTSWKIKISLEANSDMMLSKRRITKAQIGPRRSAPLLFAPSAPKTRFLALRTLC